MEKFHTIRCVFCRGEHCSPVAVYGSYTVNGLQGKVGGRTMFAPTVSAQYCAYRKISCPFPSASTVRVSPAVWAPPMISFAIIVSTWDWMYRFKGRAP